MSKKQIKETIHTKGLDISIYTEDFHNEYISLTDIATGLNVLKQRVIIYYNSLFNFAQNYFMAAITESSTNISSLAILASTQALAGSNPSSTQESHIVFIS